MVTIYNVSKYARYYIIW